ncbi:MAG: TldD/PmbA family protein [bacterium]
MELDSAMREAVVRLEAQDLDAFEIVGLTQRSLAIEVKQQMVERTLRTDSHGIAIRVMKGGRQGCAATTEINAKSVHQAVQGALAAMKKVSPSEDALLPPPQEGASSLDEDPGRPFDEIPEIEKKGLALTLESAALAADNRVTRVQHPRYEERVTDYAVVNSHGVSARASRGLCSCELKVIADGGAGAESAYEFDFSASFSRLDPALVAQRAARRVIAKLGARKMAGGRMPVIFDPQAASAMVRLLAPSFFADNIQRGKSMLKEKLGQRCFNPLVTIVDDGLLPNGLGSFPFDAEGIQKRRTIMVRDGAVESWLYDGARAAKDKVFSTGNSVRDGLGRLPAIGVGNCFLKAGVASRESLIREMGKGFYVMDLLGVHTANPISGAFSLGSEGFVVDDGALGDPVRGVTIAGNVHDLFKQIVAVGSDLRLFGSFGAPSILVGELMISS